MAQPSNGDLEIYPPYEEWTSMKNADTITHDTTVSMTEVNPADFPTVPVGASVKMYRVTFNNQYEMEVVGHLFISDSIDRSTASPAILVGAPMGAVKEQGADVYAAKLAESGYITLGIDQAFWGESAGLRRNAIAPDIYTETVMAAVDFLGTREYVDRERIGAVGICGSGSYVVSAAKLDPRIKAIATASMYDMGSVTRNGLKKSQAVEERKNLLAEAAELRYHEFTSGKEVWRDFLPMQLPASTDPITAEFHEFYRTPRGEVVPADTDRSLSQNRTYTAEAKFMNFYPFNDIETISPRPMLFITGDQAHSKEFSEDAYERAGEPKELYYVEGANHVDLYDDVNKLIPWEKLREFFAENL